MLKAISKAMLAAAAFCAMPATAQTPLDRADPSVVEEELRRPEKPAPDAKPPLLIERARPAPSSIGEQVLVGAIRVEGATELPPSAFAEVIERFVGRRLTPAELQDLAGAVAGVARDAGFGLATAWIPQQRISNGILRVMLDEGRIDAVEADGSAAAAVARFLAPIADGRPIRTARLERQLLLAGDLPGVRIGPPRVDRRGERNILRLRAEHDRFEGRVQADNWGSKTVGPVRAQLIGDLNGVFGDDDQLTLGGVVTPLQPEEFTLARIGYSKLLGRGGTEASALGYIARSRPGGTLEDVGGDSREGSIALGHYLVRRRATGFRGGLELALREATQDLRGIRIREDRLTTLTANAFGYGKLGEGRGWLRLALVQGLDLFGATAEGDLLASRRDGSAVFTKLEFWARYDQRLGKRVSMQAQAEGHVASRALLASEEMGLGGRYFLRGYDYRELSGDSGIAGSVELRYDLAEPPQPLKATQLYTYADVGTVGNHDGGIGGGALASVGGGLRFWIGKSEASIELGIPLEHGPRGDGEPRLSFTLATRL